MPPSDIVIATWWETAEWVDALDASKGQKCYFVQGHEVYSWLPQERSRGTYRLPLRKIVVSEWLKHIMELEYGDLTVDVVPNAVDHSIFNAPPRSKQNRPTVGLLYSSTPTKATDVALRTLESLRHRLPELRVLAFGLEDPNPPLPSHIDFSGDPSLKTISRIYRECDVWLTASRSEGFNLTAMEAMACRTPVVATQTGWPAEAIVQGVNGACVPVDDIAALERETERRRQCLRERGLADARQVLDQQVAARDQAGECEADRMRRADDDGLDLGDEPRQQVGLCDRRHDVRSRIGDMLESGGRLRRGHRMAMMKDKSID